MFDIRSSERYEFSDDKVEYSLGHFSDDELFDADLINASEKGLCMQSHHHLTVGQEVTVRNFMGHSSRTAIVIWVAEGGETGGFGKSDQVLFKVGLQFSD